MAAARTNYDHLKVARDAPPEVVRAAYRALAQKYHPDRNAGDLDSARAMVLVNEAYRVLSDPRLRFEHDQWIDSVEQLQQTATPTGASNRSMKPTPQAEEPEQPQTARVPGSESVDLNTLWDGIAALFGVPRKK